MSAWVKDRGDTLRIIYELDAESLVFDLGGYEGQWASDIFAKYCCAIHVFEPVPEFFKNIQQRFAKNPKIRVYNFGLAGTNRKTKIFVNKDSSSLFKKDGQVQLIELVRAFDFLTSQQIRQIDLMKINIEGGEYELLEYLIDFEYIHSIHNIQVQFHDFVPDAEARMLSIQKKLSETHDLTWQYPFVWENWRKRENIVKSQLSNKD